MALAKKRALKCDDTHTPLYFNKQSKQKTMYKVQKASKTTLKVRDAVKGETIEQKIERVMKFDEPITDGAPLIYNTRKDGVLPEHDVRTDRWEIAVEQVDAAAKGYVAKREERHKPKEETPPGAGGE